MKQKIINIGILGCGSIAQQRHLPEASADPRVNLAGVFDRTIERAQSIAQKYDTKAYGSIDELINAPEINAVVVCLPNAMHAEIAIKALKNGKDVLCEKPMATSLSECQAMLEAAEENHQRLLIAQNQRLTPTHQKARELLKQGVIGRVLTFKTTFGHGGPENWSVAKSSKTWFFNRKATKHGAMFDLGIHKIDLMQYLLDDQFTNVYGCLTTLDKKDADGKLIGVDDNAMGILQTAHGVVGNLTASWTYYGEEDNSTLIYGTQGIMKIYADPQYSIILKLKNGETVKYEIEQIQTNDNQTASGVIKEFAAAVLQQRTSVLDADVVINSMKTVFAMADSAEQGRPCSIK